MSAQIAFSQVHKSYQRAGARDPEPVLRNLSFSVAPGELVAIVGPSGVGKSTLLHLAAGLDQPDRGAVEVAAADGHAPRIGMVFQQPRLLEWLTVAQNIRLAVESAGVPRSRGGEALAEVELARFADAFPLALSGGQRQRVALARAFAVDPDIVLLDEPFSALDEFTARRLRALLQRLWLEQAPAGILVTHNTLEAATVADRILVLGGPPARIVRTVDVDLPRPRSPEDPRVFDIHRSIIEALARTEAA